MLATCNACRAHRPFTANGFNSQYMNSRHTERRKNGCRHCKSAWSGCTLTRYYALRRSPCSTCASVRSLHAHTAPPSHTDPSRPLRCFPPWCPACSPGAHIASPFISLMAMIFSRAFPQSRAAADQYASILSTPINASLPRDCPILRPRAGLPLSSGGHATLRSR